MSSLELQRGAMVVRTSRRTLIVTTTIAIAIGSGCGEHHSMPDTPETLQVPMQVVVTKGTIQVYTNAVDLGDCMCTALNFPDVGSCSYITDSSPCNVDPFCHSCITDVGIEIDGQRVAPIGDGGNDPWARYYDSFPSGQLSLVIAGCGHPTTRIPLDGPAYLQTSVTADYVSGVPHVRWTTDLPPLSSLVNFSASLGGELCHAPGTVSDYTFTGYLGGLSVEVQPLGFRADVDTEFGPATIWRAGDAYAMFPPMP
jgi:hypothetical protein